jgi:hypothetical protein
VKEIVSQNYCHEQPRRLALAEIYVNHLEARILKGSKFHYMIRHWTKYAFVHDILIVWAGTSRQADKYLTKRDK